MKKLKRITIEMLNNGYCLKFDGMKEPGGYMYFSPEKLLEGFMVHIGLEELDALDTTTMQDFIVSAASWKEKKECMAEIERLNRQNKQIQRQRNKIAQQLVNERRTLLDYASGIEELKKVLNKIALPVQSRKPLTLESLGVKSDSIIDDGEDDET
jgi:hypothetical protein